MDLNDDMESKIKTSTAHMGDHKKFANDTNKLGEQQLISFHLPKKSPIRIQQMAKLKTVEQVGGKTNSETAKHVKESMQRDGVWEKRDNPEYHLVFDNAVARGIPEEFKTLGWKRPEEHTGECQGHNTSNIKKNAYNRLDGLLGKKQFRGLFISKSLYLI